jgi:hypothetical protein
MGASPQADTSYRVQDLTVIKYRKRSLQMYPLLEQELQTLVSGYGSVHLGLFGAAFGASVSLGVTLETVPMADSLRHDFFTATLVLVLASVYCGVRAILDGVRSRKLIKQLRKETAEAIVQGGWEV